MTGVQTCALPISVSATGYKLITILVNVPVQIADGSNITTTFGLAKTSSAFTATGGTSPITFSIAPGTNGISINSSTGVVTVSATTPAGTYIETVTATDSVTATSTTTMTVLVNPAISVAGGSGITTTQGIVGTSLEIGRAHV